MSPTSAPSLPIARGKECSWNIKLGVWEAEERESGVGGTSAFWYAWNTRVHAEKQSSQWEHQRPLVADQAGELGLSCSPGSLKATGLAQRSLEGSATLWTAQLGHSYPTAHRNIVTGLL